MSTNFLCRLIVDPPLSGAWNMAVDEALLKDASATGIASLRFYEWIEPTLSLGYFQKHADRALHPASASVALVRRQSGGGAILHDHELTYSLALPPSHPFAADAHSLYSVVHEVIAALLRTYLPPACDPDTIRLASEVQGTEKVSEPFLCFQRRSPGDILFFDQTAQSLAHGHKVVGSAQRRSRGAVLQHGSILLNRSEYGPELAGLNDLCDNKLTTSCLVGNLLPQLPQAIHVEVCERTQSVAGEQIPNDQYQALAVTLQDEKYGNRLWTLKS